MTVHIVKATNCFNYMYNKLSILVWRILIVTQFFEIIGVFQNVIILKTFCI